MPSAYEPRATLQDPKGVQIHKEFIADLILAEQTITKRNEERAKGHGLPYHLLLPRSPWDERQGLTGQGIPYSVSI
jgi:hypothetical protein